ncbi:MAG TPA: outer membrane lipoprotein-sorting protein, partial [Robiginitalea sp.]|nr:outer membrane lipoprotein-sorting protein [Robiginitalea sp.]
MKLPFLPIVLTGLGLATCLAPQALTAQELSATEVVRRADEQMRGNTSEASLSIVINRPSWSREMHLKAWTKGEWFSMILVTAPAKEKGIAFLKREREVWNWIPAIERNIKLPPSMMSQSWMGTDFTNDDLVKEASAVSDYEHRHLGRETVEG